MYKILANIILRGKIECLTGLHIGGSKDKFEIGGVDSPVIRDPNTNYPYIPGSSLKGKMRTLLEFELGVVKQNNKGEAGPSDDPTITLIFGSSADESQKGPSRLIVRDCYPDEETIDMWEQLDTELLYTEFKPENTIDRLTSAANPRFMERVVKGSKFNFELIYSIYNIDKEEGIKFKYVIDSLKLLEHSSIGGSGSRGYGQIKIHLSDPIIIKNEDYVNNKDAYIKSLNSEFEANKSLSEISIDELIKNLKLE